MELTTLDTVTGPASTEPTPAGPPRGPRLPGWSLVGIVVAALVAGPLIALPGSFIGDWSLHPVARTLVGEAVRTSLLLALGVAVGTLVIGGGLAALISFYDFPGRRILDWALVLPLAMPSYVLVFVILGAFGRANPLQSNLFGDGLQFDWIRSPIGAVAILSGVLYPYVYILGRAAFLGQSRSTFDAARSLGLSYGRTVVRVALPMARPALAAGVALAMMETLADFGTVNLLGIQALTSVIYRLRTNLAASTAALQLASVLVVLALSLVAIERLARGRARYHQNLAVGEAIQPRRLQGWRALLAAVPGTVLLAVVFALPMVQLVVWSVETVADDALAENLGRAVGNTLLLGVLAAAIAVGTGTIVAYGGRSHRSRIGNAAARLATVGYAVPGTVVAVAVYVPLVWVDRRFIDIADQWFGRSIGLVFTGTILGLVLAYIVRFHALAYFAMESRMGAIHTNLDDAARSLGADRARVLADVHLPLLGPGIGSAALLVLVEVMKELPATALLRPLGGDTLAITVWEATKDSRLDIAALPALLIVVVGLIPVIILVRLLRGDGWRQAADTFS